MSYNIIANYYAPKINDKTMINSHAVSYDKCNFRCDFCDFKNRDRHRYMHYEENRFMRTVQNLSHFGLAFKFTGGEPTLNPELERDLKIVKNMNGRVFLDTNGSNPELVAYLSKNQLIDVIGISIKGLSKEEALEASGIKNAKLCWDNVIKTIDNMSNYPTTRTIVTLVWYNDFSYEKILQFSEILNNNPLVYLKLNNMMEVDYNSDKCLKKVDNNLLLSFVKRFEIEHPEWRERIILINNKNAVSNHSNIDFF